MNLNLNRPAKAMRALRKIIFINSANIRYAEVNLDGNIHFIGTQGVGKSTLLRAILFFYNADKLHLGIPKEVLSFDSFYLPNTNSYIVYEVEHEHGPFSILVFRSSGRACYRFVDAAYQKEWLVDAHGEVTAEVKVIRERLGGIYMSRLVDRYEQYRDIIYGNRQAVGKEFARFQLMETNKYQNIPRSIQNVFLNSRLDADFIKDIIIRSMSDEEANVDLGYFRRQVADFEQEYKDISCWYKLNRNGESIVRSLADAVVKTYHELLFMKQQIVNLCGELKYAERVSRERLPLLSERIATLQQESDKQRRELSDLQQQYDAEKATLNQRQGVINDKLKRLNERREYYAIKNIEQVIMRCIKEQTVKGEHESMRERLTELTARYNDVTTKYKALRQNINGQLEAFRHAQKERTLNAGQEKQKREERLLHEYYEEKTAVEQSYEEKTTIGRSAVDTLKREQNDCDKELLKLKLLDPFTEEKESLRQRQTELSIKEENLQGLIALSASDISRLQTEYDKKTTAITADYSRKTDEKQKQMEAVKHQIAAVDKLLGSIRGSLYEWLEDNKKDWERNIGKVISEEKILYQTGLHPQLTDGTTLFGVKLDIADLPVNVRKPRQLQEEKAELEQQLQHIKEEKSALQEQQTRAIEEVKRQFAPKIKELRQQKAMRETELKIIPQQRKAILLEQSDYEQKAKQLKEQRSNELNARQQDIAYRLAAAQSDLDKLRKERQERLLAVEKKHNDAKTVAGNEYAQTVADVNAETKVHEQEAAAELARLAQQETEELKGRGADTAIVEECKARIKAAESELEYIEKHRKLLYDYQRDKEELFEQEDNLKNQRQAISESLQRLATEYSQRRLKHEQQLAAIGKELGEHREEQKRINEDLKSVDDFVHNDGLCPSVFADAREKQTLRTARLTVDTIKGTIFSRQKRQTLLKQQINSFKANFTAKNTFSFRMELVVDEDYLDFANNLDDFLVNNKLEEYRRRTSERYVDILARVSKEMGDLTRHESDVDKIINDINSDFRERNFVGVIKEISLQSVTSSDKMVQLMKRIKDFNDEAQLAMGEVNLFSSMNRDAVNQKAVGYLLDFMKSLADNPQRQYLTLSDLFRLQFRIKENDNDTGWVDKLSHVGSEGTDTLVKAMINIMLINVFKEKVSRRFGDFRIHCMMDEIGKLHPQNIKGILDFASARNIWLVNSSPTTYNVSDYRYTYLLSKDANSKTVIHPLIAQK